MIRQSFYERFYKRIIDCLVSLVLILMLMPLFAVLSILVLLFIGFPILFVQDRPGKNETIFKIYKFRTMINCRDKNGVLLPDQHRLTKFGKILRSTSLDELPSLYNVLFGQMSLVGPRPLLVEYLTYYSEEQKRRHLVKPGLTGLAQIKGRNSLSWDEKFSYDLQYVKSITLKLDMYILLKTFFIVIKRVGIRSNTSVTMEKFTGNDKHNE